MVTILIAEPDDGVAELIAAVARQAGFDALRVRRTPEKLPADCVLVIEPDAPAELALARALRLRRSRLPIVCVSIRSVLPEAEALEPCAFLVKPFRVAELSKTLEAAGGLAARLRD